MVSTKSILGIVIAVIVVATLVPVAITQLAAVSTGITVVDSLFTTVMPILIVVGILGALIYQKGMAEE